MTDIVSLGYDIDTSQVLIGENALDELTESTIKADGAAKRLKSSSAEMGASVGRAGQQTANLNRAASSGAGGIRNLGLQLNQVAQQGSVTGNYMQALSIQLPDLLLGFGTLGIFAGVAAGALGPLALSLLGARDRAKETSDAFDDVSDAVQRYRNSVDLAIAKTTDLRAEFGLNAEALRDTLNILQEIALSKALDNLSVAIASIDTSRLEFLVGLFEDGPAEIGAISNNYNAAIAELADTFALTGAQAAGLMQRIRELNTAQGPQQISEATRQLNQYMIGVYGSVQKIPPEMREIVSRLAEADVAAARVQKGVEDAAGSTAQAEAATRNWAGAMGGVRAELNAIAAVIASLGGGAITAAAKQTEISALRAGNSIKDAARAAHEFKDNLRIDAEVAGLESRLGKVGTVIGSFVRGQAEYNRELDRTLDVERESAVEREKAAAKAASNSAKAGRDAASAGKKETKEYNRDLERLVVELQTERETLDVWYEESELLLNDHRARKLLGEEEHKAAMLALDAEYATRTQDLATQTAQHEINAKQNAVDAVGGLLSALSGKSKIAALALIAISKGQAIAQAIQNTAVAQVRALAELGPIAGPPAAARIAAFGKVQIAAIAATGLVQAAGSGGGSVSASGGSISATEAPAAEPIPQHVLIDMPNAPEWLKGMAEEMFTQFQDQISEGRKLVFSR